MVFYGSSDICWEKGSSCQELIHFQCLVCHAELLVTSVINTSLLLAAISGLGCRWPYLLFLPIYLRIVGFFCQRYQQHLNISILSIVLQIFRMCYCEAGTDSKIKEYREVCFQFVQKIQQHMPEYSKRLKVHILLHLH